jgi:hypothetical protein
LALVIFQIMSHAFAWADLDHDPSIYVCLLSTGTTGACHHTSFIGQGGVPLTFCTVWPRTMILLIFASQVAGHDDKPSCLTNWWEPIRWAQYLGYF